MVILENEHIKSWDDVCYDHVRGLMATVVDLLNLNRKNNINLVDVGSNVGTFTEKLHEFIGVNNAILIEPINELIEFTKTKLPTHFTYVNKVASNVIGTMNFYVNDTPTNLGMSKVIPNVIDGYTREIPSVTLTEILKDWTHAPDFIKIDAENHDIEVLEGLVKYLNDNDGIRPIINFECSRSMDPSNIINEYETLGYQTYYVGDKEYSVEYFFLPPNIKPSEDLMKN